MKTLWNWLAAKKAARKVVDSIESQVAPPMLESLEDRRMLAVAAPHVISVYADNRGLMQIRLDQKLNPASVSSKSVKVSRATAGADQAITNANISYSAAKKMITVNAHTGANVVVKVRLLSKLIKSTAGVKLDGEFKSNGKSGNGRAGGDWFGMTAAASQDVARFTTTYGIMDVRLFTSQTPLTVANFIGYANAGDWDGTIFHRSVKDFVIQGGGFNVNSSNQYDSVHTNPPSVLNEPHPGNPGNIRGTIAMARQDDQNPNTHDDENSATDEWYFNVIDNRASLDNNNGGFTAFGQITSTKGLAVMDKINHLNDGQTVNAGGAFAQLPVRNRAAIFARDPVTLIPNKDSVFVNRLAINAAVVKGVKA